MDNVTRLLMRGAAGAGGDSTYVDDVFSTYLYKGNGAAQEINNGIKLSNNNAGNGINFDKSGDYLSLGSSSDFTMGTGDFTVECWVYMRSVSVGIINGFWQISSTSGGLQTGSYGDTLAVAWDNTVGWQTYGAGTWTASMSPAAATNTWYHTAYVRSSGTSKLYINGTAVISQADTNNYNGTYMAIGGYYSTNYLMGGVISNLRVVKGTAVYTGNFTPPTKELTSITNTKLLCCNNSVITTATVTPTAITVNGDPNTSFGPFTGTDGEGGMVWTKSRSSNGHIVTDTVRGAGKGLVPNSNDASSNNLLELSSFNNSGFSIGNNYIINTDAENYTSWTWRINKGFFDVVQYTGNGSAGHQVAHSLGCEVGFMMVKRLENAANWSCYHRDAQTSGAYLLTLNSTGGSGAVTDIWNNTAPTSTHFTLGTSANTNGNGETYICYLFAGGASTAATARSVEFDGSGDALTTSTSSDYTFGTGDFTVEHWINTGSTAGATSVIDARTDYTNNWTTYLNTDFTYNFYAVGGNRIVSTPLAQGTWNHVALCRSSGTTTLYLNGTSQGTYSDSNNYTNTTLKIGLNFANGHAFIGKISNFRVVKGTAVYTSSFKPPYEPLTNITNTKLLCCNNASVTGSTVAPSITSTYSINVTASSSSAYTLSGNDRNGSVSGNNATVTANVGDTLNFAVNASGHPFYIRVSNGGYNVSTPAATNQGSQSGTVSWTPNTTGTFYYQCGNHSGMIGTITINAASGSITSSGNPTASTDSPFDDPEGFKFGEGGDQNIIKCGSYTTDSNEDADVNLGWEPQWVLAKRTDSSTGGDWFIIDSMRGFVNAQDIEANNGGSKYVEPNTSDAEADTSRMGLTSTGFYADQYGANRSYIYMALRRPDGYVGKPAEAGTDAFAMDVAGSTSPAFDSGFPVDFALVRNPSGTAHWDVGARLIQGKNLRTDQNAVETTYSSNAFDYNSSWLDNTSYSNNQSWMWKRHAGFTVCTWEGDGVTGRQIAHDMNKTVEMIWLKKRTGTARNWPVYHKGLNGGSSPEDYVVWLNLTNAESNAVEPWNDTAPTSTHFTIGGGVNTNEDGESYIAMLFASVDGISKVGRFAGNNTSMVVTTGFQPRFIIIKAASGTSGYGWFVWDSVRGMGAGNDPRLDLNTNTAQDSGYDYINITSTGFSTVYSGWQNQAGVDFIYYAHA